MAQSSSKPCGDWRDPNSLSVPPCVWHATRRRAPTRVLGIFPKGLLRSRYQSLLRILHRLHGNALARARGRKYRLQFRRNGLVQAHSFHYTRMINSATGLALGSSGLGVTDLDQLGFGAGRAEAQNVPLEWRRFQDKNRIFWCRSWSSHGRGLRVRLCAYTNRVRTGGAKHGLAGKSVTQPDSSSGSTPTCCGRAVATLAGR